VLLRGIPRTVVDQSVPVAAQAVTARVHEPVVATSALAVASTVAVAAGAPAVAVQVAVLPTPAGISRAAVVPQPVTRTGVTRSVAVIGRAVVIGAPTVSASSSNESQYSSLSGSTFAGRVNSAPIGNVVVLGAGTYNWSDFTTVVQGVRVGASITRRGLRGAGIDSSILQMVAGSSTRAADVPTAAGTTNQLHQMFFDYDGLRLSDMTLNGTSQGHLYNGLRMHGVAGALLRNLKLTGLGPGNSNIPPGETFAINDYSGSGNAYQDIEIDGQSAGATGFGTNSTSSCTFTDCYAHHNTYSAAFALWQGTGTFNLIRCRSHLNKTGFNLERMGREAIGQSRCTVNIVNPTFGTNVVGGQDIFLGNDQGSTILNIYDPVDRNGSGNPIRVYFPLNEQGNPNIQNRNDVTVRIGGTWSGGSPGVGVYNGGIYASWYLEYFGSGA
jgi:hypothetical protein